MKTSDLEDSSGFQEELAGSGRYGRFWGQKKQIFSKLFCSKIAPESKNSLKNGVLLLKSAETGQNWPEVAEMAGLGVKKIKIFQNCFLFQNRPRMEK